MSLLTDKLPEHITVNNSQFPIKTDFKHWLKFTQILLNEKNEIKMLTNICYEVFEELPKAPINDVLSELMSFYSPPQKINSTGNGEKQNRQYDFDYDAELIYSAFMQQYNIDLLTTNMHWWKFKALFDSLNDDTQFIKVVGFRAVNLSEIKDKEQKKYYAKMKRMYKLPDNRTEEEKEQAMNEMLAQMF